MANAGCCRHAWFAMSHWWDSHARDLSWMAFLVGGAVLATLLMH